MEAIILYNAIAELAPIAGVSIGEWDDKSTWRVDFKEEATKEQRDAIAAFIETYDAVQSEAAFVATQPTAVEKLQAFLDANPDIMALIK